MPSGWSIWWIILIIISIILIIIGIIIRITEGEFTTAVWALIIIGIVLLIVGIIGAFAGSDDDPDEDEVLQQVAFIQSDAPVGEEGIDFIPLEDFPRKRVVAVQRPAPVVAVEATDEDEEVVIMPISASTAPVISTSPVISTAPVVATTARSGTVLRSIPVNINNGSGRSQDLTVTRAPASAVVMRKSQIPVRSIVPSTSQTRVQLQPRSVSTRPVSPRVIRTGSVPTKQVNPRSVISPRAVSAPSNPIVSTPRQIVIT